MSTSDTGDHTGNDSPAPPAGRDSDSVPSLGTVTRGAAREPGLRGSESPNHDPNDRSHCQARAGLRLASEPGPPASDSEIQCHGYSHGHCGTGSPPAAAASESLFVTAAHYKGMEDPV